MLRELPPVADHSGSEQRGLRSQFREGRHSVEISNGEIEETQILWWDQQFFPLHLFSTRFS